MSKRGFHRLENGFGSVVKLSGHRRRPYAARMSASHTANGRNTPRAIGYYATYQEAFEALVAFNKRPFDLNKQQTFADVYGLMIKRKEDAPGGMSASVRAGHAAAFARCAPFHDIPLIDIKAPTLQQFMDDMTNDIGYGTLQNIRLLWLQMWKIAEEYDIVPRNVAKFVRINKQSDVKHSETFTPEEVRLLWSQADDIRAARLLVMIYTGFRVSEFAVIEYDSANGVFKGGIKTAYGRRRVVPIHSAIMPLVARLKAEKRLFDETSYKIRREFKGDLKALGIEPRDHSPHDCRATFATLCASAGIPDLHIKRMLGHTTGDLTKDVYTDVFVQDLKNSIEKIRL